MCRSFTRVLLALIVAVVVVLLFAPTIIFLKLQNPGYLQNALAASGVYNIVSREAAIIVSSQVINQLDAEVGLSDNERQLYTAFSRVINDEVAKAIDKVLSPEILKLTVDRNIEHLTEYLFDRKQELFFYVPKTKLVAALESLDQDFFSSIERDLLSLPLCSPSEEEALLAGDDVECVPVEVRGDLAQLDFGEIESSVKNGGLVSGFELLQGPEDISLSDLPSSPAVDSVIDQFEEYRASVRQASLGLLIAWIVVGLLLALYMVLASGNVFKRFKGVAGIAVISFLVTSILVFLLSVVSGVIPSALSRAVSESGEGVALDVVTLIAEVAVRAIAALLQPVLVISLLALGVSFAAWVVLLLLSRLSKPGTQKDNGI